MSGVTLSRRLTLERPERVSDGAGGYAETWSALGTLWGDVQAKPGRMANGETGMVSVTGYRITLRAAPVGHSNRPQPGQRLRGQGRVFAINAVSEDAARPQYLICICEEEVTP
ncbi:head-tail adaptor protein [Tropicibacter oceani]|uniref:Head-tail adaptor protein n=1 Tax=Tropicibacter oceani TaxID=3058420 RepID=A0ABY8QET2_9RHOB|nr:head-tail adaptor protein [Tropicibacter oceani]WGW02513.1 head-tail adaptor protein [Tropicibacter oceani]